MLEPSNLVVFCNGELAHPSVDLPLSLVSENASEIFEDER